MPTLSQDIISAAQSAMIKWKVPASVSLAQYGLESGWGAHAPGNNPFGIKAMAGYPTQVIATHEFVNGALRPYNLTFAAFPSISDAFDVHAKLIATNAIYAPAMEKLPDLNAFVTLMGAHYATDPLYAHKIMQIIDQNGFVKYDTVAS